MSQTYIPAGTRREVRHRARDQCEYCLRPEAIGFEVFHIDHVVAEKHLGLSEPANLALACPVCNQLKGTDLTSIDLETGELTKLFHPRRDVWSDHFSLFEGRIAPKTATGRVTVRLLDLNAPSLVSIRRSLISIGMKLTPG